MCTNQLERNFLTPCLLHVRDINPGKSKVRSHAISSKHLALPRSGKPRLNAGVTGDFIR